ncbi:MAG: hypothetical protein ABFD89_08535 [Bryobacteraceae bacterium]
MILTDPGKIPIKGKAPTKLEARAARMGAWAKPAQKVDRDKLRAERIADYTKAHGQPPTKPKAKPIEAEPKAKVQK